MVVTVTKRNRYGNGFGKGGIVRKTMKSSGGVKTSKLISITKLSPLQIKQLSQITSDKDTMKHIGMGKIWTRKDIVDYIRDERGEIHKKLNERKYFTYVMLDGSGKVIGFIAGRKNPRLIGVLANDMETSNDLLMRMFISRRETGKGYGKKIIALFENVYKGIIGKDNARLISDIAPNNMASIKIHESNGFELRGEINYPNGTVLLRYVKKI